MVGPVSMRSELEPAKPDKPPFANRRPRPRWSNRSFLLTAVVVYLVILAGLIVATKMSS
jgi:hypothetical protein